MLTTRSLCGFFFACNTGFGMCIPFFDGFGHDMLRQYCFSSISSDWLCCLSVCNSYWFLCCKATDYDPIRDQLRDPSGSLTADEKRLLWHQLAQKSFTRAMGACWLVPILDLLVRMKLHIVGRHMYLESKLPEMQSRGGRAVPRMQMPPRLSDRAKEVCSQVQHWRCRY